MPIVRRNVWANVRGQFILCAFIYMMEIYNYIINSPWQYDIHMTEAQGSQRSMNGA